MNDNRYTESPELQNYDFVKPSKEFKRTAVWVVFSIVFFIIFYLILITLAAIIMLAACWAGISLISLRATILSILIGGGTIILGIMFFVFIIKFIFSRTKDENQLVIELTEEDYPDLFNFIRSLTTDIKTQFPKKIFVSPEVNARVFYNSSFWSLLFPIRKNLEIGLGLVNTLNISEFKGVLAHEFGHFSQRSMKIGSYIYTVNHVIYNLVYEHDNWDNLLSIWAKAVGIFGFFARATFWMVKLVRGILKIIYNLINANYMKLSREMEYHADLVAVSVSGNKPFKNALRKIEFSSFAYDYASGCFDSLVEKEKASSNIYLDHRYAMTLLAEYNKIGNGKGELHVTDQDLKNNMITSRINIKDQWASHPTLEEREKNISKIDIKITEDTESAWVLFSDAELLQKQMTSYLYRTNFPDSDFEKLTDSEFKEFVNSEINRYKISTSYNGFFDNRYLTEFDPKVLTDSKTSINCFSELYSEQNVESIKRHNSNKMDLGLLNQIHLKQVAAKYFEFDGKKYKRKEAGNLIKSLKEEIDLEEQKIERLDRESFIFNYQVAKHSGLDAHLLELYETYFSNVKKIKVFGDILTKYQNLLDKVYSKKRLIKVTKEQISYNVLPIEKEFKEFLKKQDIEQIIREIEPGSVKEEIREYVNSEDYYSTMYEIDKQWFINFDTIMSDVYNSLCILYNLNLKELTDFQLNLRQDTVKP